MAVTLSRQACGLQGRESWDGRAEEDEDKKVEKRTARTCGRQMVFPDPRRPFSNDSFNRAILSTMLRFDRFLACVRFCFAPQRKTFSRRAPSFERMPIEDVIVTIKLWFDIGRTMLLKRPRKRCRRLTRFLKRSPMGCTVIGKSDSFKSARNEMLIATSTRITPWRPVTARDKWRPRLQNIRQMVCRVEFTKMDIDAVRPPDPLIFGVGHRLLVGF